MVATPYLGMVLVFMGFGRFQVSETAIKQRQNITLMQSTGQTDPRQCHQMSPRAQGRVSEKPIFLFISSSFFIHAPSDRIIALKRFIHIPNNSLFLRIETVDILFLF